MQPDSGADPFLARAMQDLRLYQAELEVQNEALISTQAASTAAMARYITLFQALPMPALVIDTQGIVQEANQEALTFFGFKKNHLLCNHSIFRLLGGSGDARLAQALRNTDTEISPQILPNLMVKAGANDVHAIEGHIARLPVQYHLDGHRLLLLFDRTAEQERDHDRAVFQSILDNANAMIYAFDRRGVCILANHAWLKQLERPLEEVINHHRRDLLSTHDTSAHMHNEHQVFTTQKAMVCEETTYSPDSGVHYWVSHKFPLKDPQGKTFAVGSITSDVTKVRRTEQRLQWAMEAFNRGSEGVLITDHNNRIVSVNRAFEEITGYTESEVVGRNPSMLSSGRHELNFYQEIWRTLLTHGRWEGELWNRRKDGSVYPQWLRASRIKDEATTEASSFIAVFSDISKRKAAAEEMERLAFYDLLTNTPNRHLLRDRLEQAIRVGTRESHQFAVIFLDLDHFKEINDVHGHDAGDAVLIEVSRRLQAVLRAQDTVCRQGGDEFILLLTPTDLTGAQTCVEKLMAAIAQPCQAGKTTLNLSVSMGVAMFPDDGRSHETLLQNADLAMYQAKNAGRNGYSFFSAEMARQASHRLTLERALRQAIGTAELSVHYQPKIDLSTGLIKGAEALMRWKSPLLGQIPPDVFIPIAEESGLIIPLGTWVIEQALGQLGLWHSQGFETLQVSVNVSAGQFWKQDLPELVRQLLSKTSVPPAALDLELTERMAMVHPERGITIMQQLKAIGVSLSMDDFGTGYSSLSYLSRLPMDVIKIDKSFVQRLGIQSAGEVDEVIVRSILQLASSLKMSTVAEGIETPEQLAFLRQHGCHQGQGYLFARPMSAHVLAAWLLSHREAQPLLHQPTDFY